MYQRGVRYGKFKDGKVENDPKQCIDGFGYKSGSALKKKKQL